LQLHFYNNNVTLSHVMRLYCFLTLSNTSMFQNKTILCVGCRCRHCWLCHCCL